MATIEGPAQHMHNGFNVSYLRCNPKIKMIPYSAHHHLPYRAASCCRTVMTGQILAA